MGSARAQGIAMAAVELFGALADEAVTAGLVNLAIAAIRTDHHPDVKGVRAQVSTLMRSKFSSLGRDDQEALSKAVESAIRALKIDDELVRATNNPDRLIEIIMSRSEHSLSPVLSDVVTGRNVRSILRIVCDWIALEIRRAPKFVQIRLDQAIEDVAKHGQSLTRLGARQDSMDGAIYAQDARLSEVQRMLDLIGGFDALRLASPVSLFGSAIDHRPRPAAVVGRVDALAQVSRFIDAHGFALVCGRELSGRFEILRAWCVESRPMEHAHAITYQSTEQLAAATEELALRYAVQPSGDIATVVAKLLWARPEITLIICEIDRVDLIQRLGSSCQASSGVLLMTASAKVGKSSPMHIDVVDLSDDEIYELLCAELHEAHLPGLQSLARALAGLPETARVAAALLREAEAPDALAIERLLSDPARILSIPLENSAKSRTQAAVWTRGLQHFADVEQFDGRLLLAAMHVMQNRVLPPQIDLVMHLLMTADQTAKNLEWAKYANARDSLVRLELAGVSDGFVNTPSLLAEFCWRQLDENDKGRVAKACLRSAKMAADRGRFSHEVVYYYCSAWLQMVDANWLRPWDVQLFDDAVLQLANVMWALDLREHSQVLLGRLLAIQAQDPNASTWSVAIRLGAQQLDIDTAKRAQDYVDLLAQERADQGELDPENECALWTLVAKSRWRTADLEGVLEAVAAGRRHLDALDDSSRALAETNLLRLWAWARASLGEVGPALAALDEAYEKLAGVAGPPALEEFRSETQEFLFRRGILGWKLWRDRELPHRDEASAVGDVIGVNSSWISVAAARSVGDFVLAEQHLDAGLPEYFESEVTQIYGVGQHYKTIWHAERVVHQTGFVIESGIHNDRRALEAALLELDDALSRFDRLSNEELELVRVQSWR
ncbi:MAG: hypothetical protein LH616_01805, partial [Ilumatobacteraceae bacterium]|nr:hypothetical protein [Ilumatobacteraceae bacterium]